MEKEESPRNNIAITDKDKVTFSEDERDSILDPSHDGLVMTLYIANHYVRRILADEGSSVKIILQENLLKMNILHFQNLVDILNTSRIQRRNKGHHGRNQTTHLRRRIKLSTTILILGFYFLL